MSVLVAIYLVVGVVLLLIRPAMTDAQRLAATPKGITCQVSWLPMVVM